MYLCYIYTLCSAIMEAGGDLGIGHAGTRVINTLRIEKGEEAWKLSLYCVAVSCQDIMYCCQL